MEQKLKGGKKLKSKKTDKLRSKQYRESVKSVLKKIQLILVTNTMNSV